MYQVRIRTYNNRPVIIRITDILYIVAENMYTLQHKSTLSLGFRTQMSQSNVGSYWTRKGLSL